MGLLRQTLIECLAAGSAMSGRRRRSAIASDIPDHPNEERWVISVIIDRGLEIWRTRLGVRSYCRAFDWTVSSLSRRSPVL